MPKSKLSFLLVLFVLISLPGYPHERGNGRPRLPPMSRDQEPQQEQQQQQQQQQQGQVAPYDSLDEFYNDVWDMVKPEFPELLPETLARMEATGLSSEELLEDFIGYHGEDRRSELTALVEAKKPELNERFATVIADEANREIVVTAFAILSVIDDLY